MKKQILLLIVLTMAFTAGAQVFVENFETATPNGNVEGYNDWYVCKKAGDALGVSPKIGEEALFYTNYPSSNVGYVAVLDSAIGVTSDNQRISTRRVIFANADTLRPVNSGGYMYYAFMVNVKPQSYRSYRDFVNWEGSETTSMTRGRIFAKNNEAGDEVSFALTKNSSSSGDMQETSSLGLTLATGVNHLLVMRYKIVEGDSNDEVSLFVNPDPTKTEAEQTQVLTAVDTQTDYSANTAMKINLRQRAVGALIGGIRVGRTWAATVMGSTVRVDNPSVGQHQIYAAHNAIFTGVAGSLKLYTLSGSEVLSAQTTGKYPVQLNKGLYLVRFTDDNGAVSSSKVLID